MKKIALFLVSLLAIVAAIAPFYLKTSETSRHTQLKRFSSYEELKNFLKASSQGPYYNEKLWGQTLGTPTRGMESNAEASIVPAYSTTNIQVEGVDEADVVKTDGTYLYVVSGSNIFIVKAYPPEEAQVLSKISFNENPQEIFIKGNKLAVFGSSISYTYKRTFTFIDDRTFVKVYDVSDRMSPVLTRNFSISGGYFNSRMIGEYVYVVVGQPAYLLYDTLVLPKIYSEEGIKEIRASEIYYADVSDYSYAFTTIVAINLQNDEQEPTHKTFLQGATSCMYVSLNNIYITFWKGEKTLIYRIRIENEKIECEADGKVLGHVLNQFSMDEYDGNFRIATTTWINGMSQNNIYVLDANLSIVGKLENIAPREMIYSARFMGDRCYLVTFRKVDPLFVIDLQNPSNPKVLGKLKITGYSDYLHPYDENHIIGIGKETVAAEEGDFAWYQGVKISLFDVSDVEKPKEIAKYEIGDRGTDSPLLRNHKALLFDKSKNLLVIPVLVAEIDEEKYPNGVPPYTHGDYVWQGAYVFDISLDGLVLKGRITHLENDTELTKSGYYFSSPYSVKRSLYVDNVLYTISDKKIKMNNLENLDEINEVKLP